MIHLLIGSYVQKPDSGFFSDWSINNASFVVCCLLITCSCHISTRLPARSWSENRMVQTKRIFARSEFSFALVEAPTNFRHNSLKAKAEGCSGKDVWP